MAGQFDKQTTRQYLLGQLGDPIRIEFEQNLLTNDHSFEELLVSEDELIDEYLDDQLTDEERQRFELYFLSVPERRKDVRFARVFNRYLKSAAPSPVPSPRTFIQRLSDYWNSQTQAMRAAEAFAMVALIVGIIWLSFLRSPAPQTFQTLALTVINNNRAGSDQPGKVTLPLNADTLKISLRLPEQSVATDHYRAELDNLDGALAEPRSLPVTGHDARSVTIVIPAAQLARGRYSLKLLAIKSDGSEQAISGKYHFDVD